MSPAPPSAAQQPAGVQRQVSRLQAGKPLIQRAPVATARTLPANAALKALTTSPPAGSAATAAIAAPVPAGRATFANKAARDCLPQQSAEALHGPSNQASFPLNTASAQQAQMLPSKGTQAALLHTGRSCTASPSQMALNRLMCWTPSTQTDPAVKTSLLPAQWLQQAASQASCQVHLGLPSAKTNPGGLPGVFQLSPQSLSHQSAGLDSKKGQLVFNPAQQKLALAAQTPVASSSRLAATYSPASACLVTAPVSKFTGPNTCQRPSKLMNVPDTAKSLTGRTLTGQKQMQQPLSSSTSQRRLFAELGTTGQPGVASNGAAYNT